MSLFTHCIILYVGFSFVVWALLFQDASGGKVSHSLWDVCTVL